MKIRSKKTGLETTITKKEWEVIEKAGLTKRYDIIEKPKAKKPAELSEEKETETKTEE